MEVVARSIVYTTAVLAVMVIEKAFESRAEQGGLMAALANVFGHPDMPKIWATTLAVGLWFLAYNVFEIVHRAIGGKRVRELFLSSNAV